MGTKLYQQNRFLWYRFSKILNATGEWLSFIPALIGRVWCRHCFRNQGLLNLVLDLCCMLPPTTPFSTNLLNGLVPTSLMPPTYPNCANIPSSACASTKHTWSSPPSSSLFRTSQRSVCFALALCVTNFKPVVTWKQTGTAIAVRHQTTLSSGSFLSKNPGSLMFHFTQNIQVRQQWRWACNLWFCATHNMGGLATPTPTTNNTSTRCPQRTTQHLSTGIKRKTWRKTIVQSWSTSNW